MIICASVEFFVYLVYAGIVGIKADFLDCKSEDGRLEMLNGRVTGLTGLMKMLKIEVTDASKIDFVCSILLKNPKLISGQNLDLAVSMENLFDGMNIPEEKPIRGNFVANSSHVTTERHQEICEMRKDFLKFSKWRTRGRIVEIMSPPGGSLYDFKSALLTRVRDQFMYGVSIDFLAEKSPETVRCYTPVHAGVIINFFSSLLRIDQKICADVVDDEKNPISHCVKKDDEGRLVFRSAGNPCWGDIYGHYKPSDFVCSKMLQHSIKMVQFVTTFKYMMDVFQIRSSDEVKEFVTVRSPPQFIVRFEQLVVQYSNDWKNGVCGRFLPSSGCSYVKNDNTTILSLDGAKEKNLCYHMPLGAIILELYEMLHKFYMEVHALSSYSKHFGLISSSKYF